MSKVVFISCVSMKSDTRSKARDLYISPLFKMNLAYAKLQQPDAIYILSAKYGLVELDQIISPYEQTLNTMRSKEVESWARGVAKQLEGKVDFKNDEITFLAGERYRKFLLPLFTNTSVPLQGLGIGKQLGWLKKKLHAPTLF